MSLLINIPDRKLDKLVEKLGDRIGAENIEVWPNVNEPERVKMALVWKHQEGTLQGLDNLAGVSSFGAGVDSILADKQLPNVPVARIVDNDLANSMANYVTTIINSHKLRLNEFAQQQALGLWKPRSALKGNKVGILGMGELGKATANFLAHAGFEVTGWSRSEKSVPGVVSTSGIKAFDQLISESDYLVCLLPLTSETRGVINKTVLNAMKPTSVLINVARGAHVYEEDLIDALYNKAIAHAYLDVFDTEPLPKSHPYWRTPNLTITPHISAVTNIDTAVEQIVDNYQRILNDQPMLNVIDREQGY